MIGSESDARTRSTREIQFGFLQYGLIECLLHVLVTLLPTLPLLMLATAVSGLRVAIFGKGLAVIALAALLCRMFGFLMYALWGRASMAGYLVGRMFLAVFLFATALHLPTLNPLRVLYALTKDAPELAWFSGYTAIMLLMTAALIFINYLLVRRHIAHDAKEQ